MNWTRTRLERFSLAACAALLITAPGAVGQQTSDQPAQPPSVQQQAKAKRADIYHEKADARQVITQAVAKAHKNNRRVLIQWGANWCGWCHLLHDTFEKNREVRRKLLYEYDLALIDVGRFDKNIELAREYGADLKANGIPFLTILDGEGKALTNRETGSLEKTVDGKPGHDPEKIMALLTKHQAQPLTAESVLNDGLVQARRENKLVFLHFGAPWCGWCHRLENWMDDGKVQPVLRKQFVDVKIDIDRMIGGKELMAEYRKDVTGGIPWFAFLDRAGEVKATSDGPKGNIGRPFTPEEIATFKELVASVSTRLTDDDIERIAAKLGKQEQTAK